MRTAEKRTNSPVSEVDKEHLANYQELDGVIQKNLKSSRSSLRWSAIGFMTTVPLTATLIVDAISKKLDVNAIDALAIIGGIISGLLLYKVLRSHAELGAAKTASLTHRISFLQSTGKLLPEPKNKPQ